MKPISIYFFILFLLSGYNYFTKPLADYSRLWHITHGLMTGGLLAGFLFI